VSTTRRRATMHPEFLQRMVHDRERELERQLRSRAEYGPTATQPGRREQVVLRLCSVHDDESIERLAALEGRPAPTGRHVVAEVDGVVVAALPLEGGPALADPFHPTAHLLPLLELRAKRLAPKSEVGRRHAWIPGMRRSLSRA
jgi:hypothetical protein